MGLWSVVGRAVPGIASPPSLRASAPPRDALSQRPSAPGPGLRPCPHAGGLPPAPSFSRRGAEAQRQKRRLNSTEGRRPPDLRTEKSINPDPAGVAEHSGRTGPLVLTTESTGSTEEPEFDSGQNSLHTTGSSMRFHGFLERTAPTGVDGFSHTFSVLPVPYVVKQSPRSLPEVSNVRDGSPGHPTYRRSTRQRRKA
jgi:hypothetical protein